MASATSRGAATRNRTASRDAERELLDRMQHRRQRVVAALPHLLEAQRRALYRGRIRDRPGEGGPALGRLVEVVCANQTRCRDVAAAAQAAVDREVRGPR